MIIVALYALALAGQIVKVNDGISLLYVVTVSVNFQQFSLVLL
jgi:hypothetical protein